MILKNMRWNYNGRGHGFAAEEGIYLAETMVTDDRQQSFFVLAMREQQNCRIYLSEMPMIDIAAYAEEDGEFDQALNKLDRRSFARFQCRRAGDEDWDEDDEDALPMDQLYPCPGMYGGELDHPVRLTLASMENCLRWREPDDRGAYQYSLMWLGEDISQVDLGY